MTEAHMERLGSDQYQYQPLSQPGDIIRLLVLEPHQDLEAPVRCSLINGSLSQYDDEMIDHYTALSYVWGDAAITRPVLVDGKALDVTVNLDSALRHMRDKTRIRMVWADAICINQKNDEEKSHQVAQMNLVYANAQHTVIYLGESNNETDLVFESVRSNSKAIGTNLPYESVLTRPWFTRVWIYQELIFSRDPWLQCGCKRIRWDKFIASAKLQRVLKAAEYWETILYMANERRRIQSLEDRYREPDEFRTLALKTLVARRGLGVCDPRDMLFAHRSILGVPQGGVELQKLLEIDYTKSCREVYADLARYHILASLYSINTLETFSHIESFPIQERNDNDIPSWAPNWTSPGLLSPYCRLREGVGNTPGSKSYMRGDDQTNRSYFWIGRNIFVTFGFSAGVILRISSIIMKADEVESKLQQIHTTSMMLSSRYIRWLAELKNMHAPFDISIEYGDRSGKDIGHCRDNLPARSLNDGSDFSRHLLANDKKDTDYPRFVYGRRFALVKHSGGLKLALVPAATRVGDEMFWSIDDLGLPFVVRPRQIDSPSREEMDSKIREQAFKSCEVKHAELVGEGWFDGGRLTETVKWKDIKGLKENYPLCAESALLALH